MRVRRPRNWQEAEAATQQRWEAIGLRVELVPGSGSGFRKGDCRTRDLLLEQKFTEKKGQRITRQMLRKLELDGHQTAREGVLCLTFADGPSYYVLRADFFEQMLERMVELEDLS